MSTVALHQPPFDVANYFWEMQTCAYGKPDCWLLKCPGHPYPHGSVVSEGGMNPIFGASAFTCDDAGQQTEIWAGWTDQSLEVAQEMVVEALT